MNRKVYCIAVLGQTPAILTELVWWLVMREHAHVVGLEVWTTASFTDAPNGFRTLEQALTKYRIWDQLMKALGSRRHLAPPLPKAIELAKPNEISVPRTFEHSHPLTIVGVTTKRGQYLADVRNDEDARLIASRLHERVRTLRTGLPADVVVLGSLAGGRKTMTAALHSAFELQARSQDRLVHVLAHPNVETEPTIRERFVVPTAAVARRIGVPVDEQVRVYDVPFLPLRELLSGVDRKTGDVLREFEARDLDQLVSSVRRKFITPPRARLRQEQRKSTWWYEVLDGDEVIDKVRLSRANAETLAAVVLAGGTKGATAGEIYDALQSAGVTHGAMKGGALSARSEDEEAAEIFARKRAERLRRALGKLMKAARDDFGLRFEKRPTRYVLAAGDRVEGAKRVLFR